MSTAALTLLALSGLAVLVRLFRGPSVADRIIAVDGLLVIVIGAIAVDAAIHGRTAFVDVAVVIGLLAFVGTGVTARFIERRGG
jgi:multicomponent Na+:H+ antiporter subunit F